MAMLFPIDRAEEEDEHAHVDEGAMNASADVLASARAAIAARVGLLGMVVIATMVLLSMRSLCLSQSTINCSQTEGRNGRRWRWR